MEQPLDIQKLTGSFSRTLFSHGLMVLLTRQRPAVLILNARCS